jgi:hypothetical protein
MQKGEADRRVQALHTGILEQWSHLHKLQRDLYEMQRNRKYRERSSLEYANSPDIPREQIVEEFGLGQAAVKVKSQKEHILQNITEMAEIIQKGSNDSRSDEQRLRDGRNARTGFVIEMSRRGRKSTERLLKSAYDPNYKYEDDEKYEDMFLDTMLATYYPYFFKQTR